MSLTALVRGMDVLTNAWWAGVPVTLFVTILAAFYIGPSKPPFYTVTGAKRIGAVVTAVVMMAACVAFVVKGVQRDQEIAQQIAAEKARFAKFIKPLADELTRLGFEPWDELTFTDRSTYTFAADTANSGTVTVRNKDGKPIKIHFMITESGGRIGCEGENQKLLTVGPYGAQLLRATPRGCP